MKGKYWILGSKHPIDFDNNKLPKSSKGNIILVIEIQKFYLMKN